MTRNMMVAYFRARWYDMQRKGCINNDDPQDLVTEAGPMAVKSQTAQPTTTSDRIEKRVMLRAPRSRVWRTITNAQEFGSWFGMKLEGAFAEGRAIRGRITHPGYEQLTVEMLVERIEPERYFSYRWHPYAIDPAVDYSSEATTLVEFTLEEAEGGTAVTIVESGFDRIPPARRAEAFRMNDQGWTGQVKNLERYVA
jgi:uncharacterized protein YndB with AHSA1/START domain